jgi:5-(carboxyamino)imidazole ribonucleotide synthase
MAKYDIGILGGGQLGKMLIEEGLRFNLRFATLDAEQHSPASYISHHHITGTLYDAEKIQELVNSAQVSTYEIEHIDVDTLKALAAQGHRLIPSPEILEMIQDKGLQKDFFRSNNIPTAPYVLVNDASEWKLALTQFDGKKIAAKLRKGGYDGKGVALLTIEDIYTQASSIPFDAPCVLEAFIPCEKEISIMVARDSEGNTACFPAVEMEFDPVANLVSYLVCPANISEAVNKEAERIAMQVVNKANALGIFAIEMFVLADGQVLVNEVAPRPHNSMHHTIEACYTSQYEQLIRILTNRPLGSTALIQPAAMINVLGGAGFEGPYTLQGEAEILKLPGVYVHLYDKAESKPMRKLGHITIMAATMEELKQKADFINKTIAIIKK